MKDWMELIDSVGSSIIFIIILRLRKERIVNQTVDLRPAVSQAPGAVGIRADIDICIADGLCQISKSASIGLTVSAAQQEMIIGIKCRPSRLVDKFPSHDVGLLDDPVKAGFQLLLLRHAGIGDLRSDLFCPLQSLDILHLHVAEFLAVTVIVEISVLSGDFFHLQSSPVREVIGGVAHSLGSGEKNTLLTEKIGLAVDGLKSFSKRSVISEVGKSVRELLPAFSCASVCFQKIKFSIYAYKAVLFDRSPVICPVFFPFIKDPGILYQLSSLTGEDWR